MPDPLRNSSTTTEAATAAGAPVGAGGGTPGGLASTDKLAAVIVLGALSFLIAVRAGFRNGALGG